MTIEIDDNELEYEFVADERGDTWQRDAYRASGVQWLYWSDERDDWQGSDAHRG